MAQGGSRAGAGRKASSEGRRVSFSCRVLPSTREAIRMLKDRGVPIGEIVDRAVREYIAQ